MRKFLKIFKSSLILHVAFFMTAQAQADDIYPRYVGELHPPVLVSDKDKKIVAFFLKSNFKKNIENPHVPTGEIYYFQIHPLKPALKYVWKVEGDQISSVFFYDWKTPLRAGRSMYVLTKTIVSNRVFSGVSYTAIEFPIILEGEMLSINFFPGDLQDSQLQNCLEGVNIKESKKVFCAYKNAGDIKKYLELQDR